MWRGSRRTTRPSKGRHERRRALRRKSDDAVREAAEGPVVAAWTAVNQCASGVPGPSACSREDGGLVTEVAEVDAS